MTDKCKWCERKRRVTTGGALVCLVCDLTPFSSIPKLPKQ